MNNGTLVWQIILQIILIMLNAIFASAEIAVISLNDAKLAKLTNKGEKQAIKLSRLKSQPAKFLATIQVAITLSGFLGSAFAADNFSDILVNWLISLGVTIPAKTLDSIAVVVITLILSYFTLVFGELVPKRIAMRKSEQLALGIASLVSFISRLFAPIVWLLTKSTNAILRMLRVNPNEEDDDVTEEEIRAMIDVGSEKGTIDAIEKEMIHNVFEFDDTLVGDIMTHRTDVVFLWLEDSLETWNEIIKNNKHTFYPICGESIDEIVGILDSKIYFRLDNREKKYIIKKSVKQPFYVPETVKADIIFTNMKKSKVYFAVIVDEYGGVSGILTMNDLLELIVGKIGDDIDTYNQPFIEELGNNTWKITGEANAKYISNIIGIELYKQGVETLSGYILSNYGTVPDDGNLFDIIIENIKFQVLEIKDHTVKKVIITVLKDDNK